MFVDVFTAAFRRERQTRDREDLPAPTFAAALLRWHPTHLPG
jgi:hypothetical protein